MALRLCFVLCVLFISSLTGYPDVVINEIHYHPIPRSLRASTLPDSKYLWEKYKNSEFLELFNPDDADIDLSGWQFTKGITYTFPLGSTIRANDYILIVKDRTLWGDFEQYGKMAGPYEGQLSESGETITLCTPDGRVVDQVKYKDDSPWARGADGYGPSLERISADLPSNDSHTWRASLTIEGSPLKENTNAGALDKPHFLSSTVSPQHPKSIDQVQITAVFSNPELIESAALCVKIRSATGAIASVSYPMEISDSSVISVSYQCQIPPFPSQSLIRCWFDLLCVDRQSITLPPASDPCPYISYFIYDGEIFSQFPLLWVYYPSLTIRDDRNPYRSVSGVVIKPVTAEFPIVFDGAFIEIAQGGIKVKFLKNENYFGITNLKVTNDPFVKDNNYGNPTMPVVLTEDFSYHIFKTFPTISPLCEWCRVIADGNQSPRTVIQRPNERFFELNGRDKNGDIYKSYDNMYIKKSNFYESDDEFLELIQSMIDKTLRADTMEKMIDRESFLIYDVLSVFTSNWDSFHKNHILFHNPPPIDRWEIVPWDLDSTLSSNGYDFQSEYSKMWINFPLTGEIIEKGINVRKGILSAPMHSITSYHQAYLERLQSELNGRLAQDRLLEMADERESLLLDDVNQMEKFTGNNEDKRRKAITDGYKKIRQFIKDRYVYLRSVLPTDISDFMLY